MPARKPPPGNPEWVKWIEDMAADAEKKGSKASQSYKKVHFSLSTSARKRRRKLMAKKLSEVQAAFALRSNPITMTHPDEARQLVGVGQKVVDCIRREMERKAAALGLPMPDLGSFSLAQTTFTTPD
jgi:hypothetical protein